MTQYLSAISTILLMSFSQVLAAEKQLDQSPHQLSAFTQQLATLKQQKQILGLAAAVVKDNKVIWSQGYGFADADRTVPMTPDTPMWIASVTKTFVGLTFLKLAAEEAIDLSDLAAETPDFTGLCEWLASTTIPFGQDLHCDANITIENILNHQVNGNPGTGFLYNPIMYSRLSRYLEHKFGHGVDAVEGRHNYLAQQLDRLILEPADMQRTMASQWDRSKSLVYFDMATGFTVNNNNYQPQPRPERHLAGGAGVVSTVYDLVKYDVALNTGLIIDEATKNTLFNPAKFNNGQLAPYGFGWYFQTHQGEPLMWHSGWDEAAGFSALMLKVPRQNLTFIVLANGEGLWWGNPLDKAEVHHSDFAKAFLNTFLFDHH